MIDLVDVLNGWAKFELGMDPPPPLNYEVVAAELTRLRRVNAGLVEALELLVEFAWNGEMGHHHINNLNVAIRRGRAALRAATRPSTSAQEGETT